MTRQRGDAGERRGSPLRFPAKASAARSIWAQDSAHSDSSSSPFPGTLFHVFHHFPASAFNERLRSPRASP